MEKEATTKTNKKNKKKKATTTTKEKTTYLAFVEQSLLTLEPPLWPHTHALQAHSSDIAHPYSCHAAQPTVNVLLGPEQINKKE